ncbi:hypothetical protein TVAG_185650 [Trichomonas vaginalis G3]|uniref:Uncharacterized protein n=1 Tax=Trichomonas vaginalis (strain ATCC PRA-98 / G3) TaxID=412133 RepID=A2D8K9_TRIV3|nr:hypothetical protein TVAGG3_0392620 [Trichomonas vaginalis G3]EAY23258.1 hypothetical protein TVAG_185650 [Trichomonas vaginalis G3]KAI5534093.1 hypothetical protein TVAGG3_0392620 [Trichomonas vaginalis G3]|eukprot:XP_001584244.1 hypothetical protein [Trichomonas vaginalis G3]
MFAATQQNNYLCYGKVAVANQKLNWDDYWIKINGFWIEISKKVGQPDYFLIPLDLTKCEGAYNETGFQNSIYLETTNLTNSFKVYIATTNRLDILQLFQTIKTGQKIIASALQKRQIERMVRHDVETVSGFFGLGKEKLQFSMGPQGLDLSGGKSAPQHYDWDKVVAVYAKQNDQNCHTRLIVAVEENDQTSTKEYNCQEHSSVMNSIACYLMNIAIKRQMEEKVRAETQAANNAQPPASPK